MALSCDSHFLNKMGGQSYLPEVKRGRAWGRGCTRAQLGGSSRVHRATASPAALGPGQRAEGANGWVPRRLGVLRSRVMGESWAQENRSGGRGLWGDGEGTEARTTWLI